MRDAARHRSGVSSPSTSSSRSLLTRKPLLARSGPVDSWVGSPSPEEEAASQKKWFWLIIIASAASLVLSLLEILLCVHLLLEDTWSGLEVFVLDLVVWLLIFLAFSGIALSLLGMWIISSLVEAPTLLGLPTKEELKREQARQYARRRRNHRSEAKTLLTDAPSTSPTAAPAAVPDALLAAASTDESILSISGGGAEEDEESKESDAADPSRGLRAALRDPDAPLAAASPRASRAAAAAAAQASPKSKQSSSKADALSSDDDASEPDAQEESEEKQSFTVQVQQVVVSRGDALPGRSLNSDSSSSVRPVTSSSTGSTPHSPSLLDLERPTPSDNILSAYLNMSVLLFILYFGFSLLLLAQRGQVAAYVHTHALIRGITPTRHSHGIHHNFGVTRNQGEPEDPADAADVLKTQLSAYLAVMGVCALFSSKLLTVTSVATWIIQRKQPPTQQAYLTSHLTTGLCGCILLSLRIYIEHHQTFVPLHAGEIGTLGWVGSLLLLSCFVGLGRFYARSVEKTMTCKGLKRHGRCLLYRS